MSGVVELARMPTIEVVNITGSTDEQSVTLPGECMKFVIFSPTTDAVVYWAVEQGEVTSATGKRRTIPVGELGGSDKLRLINGATLYLSADRAARIELEIYRKY